MYICIFKINIDINFLNQIIDKQKFINIKTHLLNFFVFINYKINQFY